MHSVTCTQHTPHVQVRTPCAGVEGRCRLRAARSDTIRLLTRGSRRSSQSSCCQEAHDRGVYACLLAFVIRILLGQKCSRFLRHGVLVAPSCRWKSGAKPLLSKVMYANKTQLARKPQIVSSGREQRFSAGVVCGAFCRSACLQMVKADTANKTEHEVDRAQVWYN